jgi:uncharacterized protein (TIGR03437 family)
MQSLRAFLCFSWLLGVAVPLAEPPQPRLRASNPLAGVPLGFEANRGQADRAVKYLSRGPGYTLLLTASEAVMALREGPVVRMRWTGANARSKVEGLERLPGQTNYFLGSDPSRWQTGVPSFRKVRYPGLYPGIDLVLYDQQGRLEYDWVVSPGADLGAVRLEFAGAETRVDEGGDLVVKVSGAELRHRRPRIYQQVGGARKELAGGYRLLGDGQVGFDAEGYDPGLPLVVDPVLVYSTYLGGSGNESAYDLTADAAGNVYVTGWTTSATFPLPASYQRTARGQDAFVAKINAAGNALVFWTYLGGSGSETAYAIAVDGSGNVYLTGYTTSTDFPVLRAFQSTAKGQDAFVTKLNASGSALVYSTYLGGSNVEVAYGIAVDDAGSAYAAGYTYSQDFPTQNPIQAALQGTQDAFVTKLAPAGSSLVYSTYLGGAAGDAATAIAVDAARNAYVTGNTGSLAFPLVNPLQDRRGGTADTSAFVSKLNPAGTALVYSTYLGGADSDNGEAIAVNAAGEAYVVGRTRSKDFPTAKALQPSLGGGQDAFLAQLNAAGSALKFSTYLGGAGEDVAYGVALDPAGNVYVAGATESDDFPFVQALQPLRGRDAFAMKISAAGTTVYATPIGGSGSEGANGIAVDGQGNAYVAGYTISSDFPTAAPLQGTYAGGTGDTPFDAMVVKIFESGTPAAGPLSMVSAASFAADALAPESIASAYGQNLAAGLAVAETPALPEQLGDTTMKVTDSAGVERTASLFFVSPGQVNFLVPAGTATGRALVKVLRDSQTVASGSANVAAVAPGLFTANANGKGVAAALALRVTGDGAQSTQLIFECAGPGQCSGVPVDPGPESDQVFLMLFGTGIRGRSSDTAVRAAIGGVAAEVTGAVPQGQYPGLDQVNVRLPRSLAGKGEVNIALTVDGKAANTVTVRVGGTPPPPPPAPPSIATITPAFAFAGDTIPSLTLTGENLAAVTAIDFGDTGFAVSDLRTTATSVAARVAIAADTQPALSYLVSVLSPGGRSNRVPFEVQAPRTGNFLISNLRAGPATVSGNTLTLPVEVDFADPSGSASSGQVTASVGTVGQLFFQTVTPQGLSAGQTSGTLRFTLSLDLRNARPGSVPVGSEQPFSLQLKAQSDLRSNILTGAYRVATPVLPGGSYLPLATGMSWEYRVQFAEQASLPYQPIFEAPDFMLCGSLFCGTGTWPAGQIDFKVTAGEKLSTATGDSYRATLTDPGRKFFFYLTDPQLATEMRVREVSGAPQLEILGSLQADYFRFYRPLARVAASDLTATQTLAVPAGEFKDVIKTSLTLTGDGSYLRGTYTTEAYLAPNVGLIKAVQKDSGGKVLYTQELTRVWPLPGAPRITKIEPTSFKAGETVTITITGVNLSGVTDIKYGGPYDRLRFSEIKATATTVTARVTVSTSPAMINIFEFGTVWVVSPAGESNSPDVLVTRP